MMRKYFPLEASERLFVAIEEDDVVDAQVSLPPTIALSCTIQSELHKMLCRSGIPQRRYGFYNIVIIRDAVFVQDAQHHPDKRRHGIHQRSIKVK